MNRNIIYVITGVTLGVLVSVCVVFIYVVFLAPTQPEIVVVPPVVEVTDPNIVSETDSELILSYVLPDSDTFEGVDLGEIPKKAELPESVVIPLPLDVVTQEYSDNYNRVVNDIAKFEAQMQTNVLASMAQVQTAALAGAYLDMFGYILDAKDEIDEARRWANKLNTDVDTMRSSLSQTTTSDFIAVETEKFLTSIDQVSVQAIVLLNLLDKSLSGKPPTQTLINSIENASIDLTKKSEVFAEELISLTKHIQEG